MSNSMSNSVEYPGPLSEAEFHALGNLVEAHGAKAVFSALAYWHVQEEEWNRKAREARTVRKVLTRRAKA